MEKLKALLGTAGFEQIQTYIQSGNVILKSTLRSSEQVSRKIEDKIVHDSGLPVAVISRTVEELAKIVKSNPFSKDKSLDPAKLHVTFLSQAPLRSCLPLPTETPTGDEVRHAGREVYLYCPNGMGRAKLPNVEKLLSVRATTRNWRTVTQLYQIALGYR